MEGQLAPALHRVRDAGKIEHKNQLPELLSLTALTYTLGRHEPENPGPHFARRLKRDLLSGAMTPEQWSSIRQTELRAGVPERLMPDFNEAKRLARSGRWEPPQPRTAHREIFPQSVVWIEEILSARRWSLWRADPAKTGFICSDCPLSSLKGEPGQPGLHLAPLGDSDAMLTFPLSAHLALASLEGLTQGNHVATDLIVGDINTRTKLASTGLLYLTVKGVLAASRGQG